MEIRRGTAIGLLALILVVVIAPLSLAPAEVVQKRGVRVSLNGSIAPTRLPRKGAAPVAVSLAGRISATDGDQMPQLRTVRIEINREGHLSSRGLPLCRVKHISPATSQEALRACGASLVGEGSFSADVRLPEQSPFPSRGKVLAFNGRFRGQPAILAHIYGTDPAPTSYVLPFVVRSTKGTFGTVLEASLPRVTGDWGFVTGIAIKFQRRFTYRGKQRSFVSAGCPAPPGFGQAPFPLMRGSFGFDQGLSISSTVTRTCRARG